MEQSWIMGLIGGLIIGCAGAVYLLMNGRIMGASGVIGGLIDGSGRNMERGSFLAGLFIVPAILAATVYPSQTNVTSNLFIVAAAGLLVGIGTRIANGCTSGHGVCGISRLSLRGIVATVFYILAGGLTVVLFRHILGVI
ncbi:MULTISPECIES: YeeE/YedE family protein [Falsihalocynthiibacter]|uniref:YeeE/YedE family protein n=1 Tax=Falsihalocynthiibacter TaxID=2854182 RepID=UPI0030011803